MQIALLFCDTRGVERGISSDGLPDQDEAAVEPIVAAVRRLGHEVRPVGVTFERLEELPRLLGGADAVFNLCDGSGVDGSVGPGAPALLQHLHIPFTGCSADPYLLSTDKARARRVLAAAGVPVPAGQVVASEAQRLGEELGFPVIVKPREGFGSLGVDERSVVRCARDLPGAIARARRAGDGDVLVERFLPGRELSVALLGAPEDPTLLPAVEFRFGAAFHGRPAVRTLRSKHDPTSAEYRDIQVVQAELDAPTAAAVEEVSRAAWRALGGDGYGRVDLRLDEEGRPFVIEVNANCSLEIGPDPFDCGTMVLAARLAGWDDERLLGAILSAGLQRSERGMPAVCSAASGRWTMGTGHALHALRELSEGEILAALDEAPAAGRGARRPWRVAGEWVVPDPPVRWARTSRTSGAEAIVAERAGSRQLAVARPVSRFAEVRVAGRSCRRGPRVHVISA